MPVELQHALIINAAVLLVVLEGDLGRHRKITRFRVLRPLITAGAVVPLFLSAVATSGAGLILEVALTAAGIILGLATAGLMTVYRSPRTGKPASRTGLGYAAVWIAVIGARAAFSYGSVYWFGPQLARWMATNAISSAALTDAIIFMAIAMVLTRTIAMGVRAVNVGTTEAARPARPATASVR
ncbi:hypothetical protein K6U06_20380 [Acidiferrimicrobium sp. IK]|uniref:hypothetical protein n=1 Tax=Acidiferrimicrobium sp. IK TaxID=2871700 RepID=UPI0021CB23BA|nr:hypothetical protein [Acidiferrimicrobium sp. IK]MCU4186733.1 hypothetical protein [Acidiferrimicrobium sp. IK]